MSKERPEEIIKNAGLKCPRLYNIVLYKHNHVKGRLSEVPLKHTTFKWGDGVIMFKDLSLKIWFCLLYEKWILKKGGMVE